MSTYTIGGMIDGGTIDEGEYPLTDGGTVYVYTNDCGALAYDAHEVEANDHDDAIYAVEVVIGRDHTVVTCEEDEEC